MNKATKRPQTETDVRVIWNYVADRSPRAADALLVELESKFDFLADMPLAGRARFDLAPEIRSFPCGSYVIFYVVVSTGVEIVRVMHGSQDITAEDFE